MGRQWGFKLLLVVVFMVSGSGCGKFSAKDKKSGADLFSLGAVGTSQRSGAVVASNRALKDDQGEFHALGATMMWALWAYKYDRPRLEADLDFLSSNGFDYIRVLGTLGKKELADYKVFDSQAEAGRREYWKDRWMTSAWPDYDQQIAGLTDLAYDKYGIRVEWTIFGGAFDYSVSEKKALVDRFLTMSAPREHKIMHFEIGNESWQNGFDQNSSEMRDLTKYMNDRTRILVAASAPQSHDSCEPIKNFYDGNVADIGTIHFDRNIGMADGGWRPVRQPWEYSGFMHGSCGAPVIGSNNEPIGPGASVNTETDQYKLVAAAMVTYISGLPLYVYHTDSGVRGLTSIANEKAATSFVSVKSLIPNDIMNWTSFHTGRPDSPFGADAIWSADGSDHGIVRAYGARNGGQFIQLPMGIKNYTNLTANQNLKFEAFDIISGEKKGEGCLRAGEKVKLTGLSVFLLKGEYTSACASTPNITIGGAPLTSAPVPVPSGPTFKLRVAMTSLQNGSIGQVTGSRGLVCNAGVCEKLYAVGSEVSLNGVSTQGNQFLHFKDGSNPCGIQVSGETFVMDRDRDCIAVFEDSLQAPSPTPTTPNPVPVNGFKLRVAMVSLQNQGTGLVSDGSFTCDEGVCEKVYTSGAQLVLNASNTDGNRFVRFQNGERECGISASGQALTMDRDRDCVAVFENTTQAPAPAPSPTPSSSGIYSAGSLNLSAGQSVSANGYTLNFQNDGNLVVYRNGNPVWATNTQQSCNSGCSANFQTDGNLVLYKNGNPYWASNTNGRSLILGGNEGPLVIR